MKSDINLLYKRKSDAYTGKKAVIIIVTVASFAIMLYLGISIPSGMLAAAKIESNALQSSVDSSSTLNAQLIEKNKLKESLAVQLEELETLSGSKENVLTYLNTIEQSKPDEVSDLTILNIYEDKMEIQGYANDDEVVATFCLRLRQRDDLFKSVFLSTSRVENNITMFYITVTLPQTLVGDVLIRDIQNKYAPSESAAPQEGSSK